MAGGDDEKPGLSGGIREKLVATKQQWARDGRALTGEAGSTQDERRLPPGQVLTRDWPVLDLGIQPDLSTDRWSLTVDGAVEHPLTWDWAAFSAQPQVELVTDIHCVTTWSRYDNAWSGVTARHLLSLVRPKPEARFVVFGSADDYTTNLPLERFDDDDVLLAHAWHGRPLSASHGGPVRAVVPKLYFWKSAKWLTRITFTEVDRPGFWETRGYHNHGDPWKEERYG